MPTGVPRLRQRKGDHRNSPSPDRQPFNVFGGQKRSVITMNNLEDCYRYGELTLSMLTPEVIAAIAAHMRLPENRDARS